MNVQKCIVRIIWSIGLFIVFIPTIFSQNEIEFRTDGVVLPRTDTLSVVDVTDGMMIFDTLCGEYKGFDGSNWKSLSQEGVTSIKTQQKVISAYDFNIDGSGFDDYTMIQGYCYLSSSTNESIFASIDIPVGATLTNVSLICQDTAANNEVFMRVYADTTAMGDPSSGHERLGSSVRSTHQADYQSVDTSISTTPRKEGETYFVRIICTDLGMTVPTFWVGPKIKMSKLIIDYELPE